MAKLVVKEGVQPHVIRIIAGVANVAAKMVIPPEVVITSGIDGNHGFRSLHYALRGLDVRSKNFPTLDSKERFAVALRNELGLGYQVILEHIGEPNEHFHIEFDPR